MLACLFVSFFFFLWPSSAAVWWSFEAQRTCFLALNDPLLSQNLTRITFPYHTSPSGYRIKHSNKTFVEIFFKSSKSSFWADISYVPRDYSSTEQDVALKLWPTEQ